MATRLPPEPSDPVGVSVPAHPYVGPVPPPDRAPRPDGFGLATPRPAGDLFEGAAWTLVSGLADTVSFTVALIATAQITGQTRPPTTTAALIGLFAIVSALRMASRGMYGARPARMPVSDQVVVIMASIGGASILALATAALSSADRAGVAALAVFSATAGLTVSGGRVALWFARRKARRRGRSGKRTIIVGAGEIGTQLAARLREAPELGLIPIGFCDREPPVVRPGVVMPPLLGPADQLEDLVLTTGAAHVIFAFTRDPDSVVLPLLRRCQRIGIEVSVVPRLFENANERQWIEHVGGLPLVELRQTDPHGWRFTAKHAIDRILAALILAAIAPILALLAIGVRMSSPGPTLFRQRRIGRDGTEFDILKFRSMRVAPHDHDSTFRARVGKAGTAPGGVEGFDRRTTFGTWIRRTSLDELPQLLNVLFGHMSLVGPRPERPAFVAMFGEELTRYDDRHLVKSGITGWAQVHGLRGQTSLADRVEWDNWYIQNWSLWLDLKILLMTPLAVLRAPDETTREPITPSVQAVSSPIS